MKIIAQFQLKQNLLARVRNNIFFVMHIYVKCNQTSEFNLIYFKNLCVNYFAVRDFPALKCYVTLFLIKSKSLSAGNLV